MKCLRYDLRASTFEALITIHNNTIFQGCNGCHLLHGNLIGFNSRVRALLCYRGFCCQITQSFIFTSPALRHQPYDRPGNRKATMTLRTKNYHNVSFSVVIGSFGDCRFATSIDQDCILTSLTIHWWKNTMELILIFRALRYMYIFINL